MEYDILYIESDDDPEVAEYEPAGEDTYLRVTPAGKTVGALIFDYSTKNEEWLNEVLPNELFEHLKKEWIKI